MDQLNPGRINSLHLKDWAPDKGYKVLFGEGKVPWKQVLQAAEKTGGVEYYLIEQEGSAYPPFETAEKCLAEFKTIPRLMFDWRRPETVRGRGDSNSLNPILMRPSGHYIWKPPGYRVAVHLRRPALLQLQSEKLKRAPGGVLLGRKGIWRRDPVVVVEAAEPQNSDISSQLESP